MSNFIYQVEKEEKEDSILVKLYSTNEKYQNKLKEIKLNYSILMKKKDFESLKIESDRIFVSEKDFLDKNEEKIVKIEFKTQELFNYVLGLVKESDMITYEGDLNPEHKYLIDNQIKILEREYFPLKYISIDIETIGKISEQEIVLISSYGKFKPEIKKVYINLEKISNENIKKIKKHKFDFVIELLENEKEVLQKFKEDLINYEAQIIVGWNVIDFDFKVIKERMNHYEIPFSLSKYEGEGKLRINSDFFRSSTLSNPGVIVFDVIELLKKNFIIFEDYKLNTVSKEVLNDEKIDLEDEGEADEGISEKIHAIENMLKKDTIKLIEYNFKDSLLTSKIIEKLNLLELMVKRSEITNTPIAKIRSPIATLDIMYLKELHKKLYVANSNFNFSESNPIEGAYVINPKQGFYEDVFVFDFKSLYPSVIMTFNIDPFTFTEKKEDNAIFAPNEAYFKRERGILPDLIKTLYLERDKAKKKNDKVMSHALKITMNSFYGSMASPKSRFYNKAVGEAITSFARLIIQKAQKYCEDNGHYVIYGDTDSIFVKVDKKFKDLNEKKNFGNGLMSDLNIYFNNWVKKDFEQESYLTIEFEKIYSRFFIASKKKYVGYDELTKNEIFVGMEAIRGDWTELAQNFQKKLVHLIFNKGSKKDIETFILETIQNLKKGNLDGQLIYKKKITKPLNQYTKTTPPHVKAARELENFSGRTVKYIMTKDGPKHISFMNSKTEYDYEHYIEKQLKGVSDDLLNSLDINFDSIIFAKKQTSLDKFW